MKLLLGAVLTKLSSTSFWWINFMFLILEITFKMKSKVKKKKKSKDTSFLI